MHALNISFSLTPSLADLDEHENTRECLFVQWTAPAEHRVDNGEVRRADHRLSVVVREFSVANETCEREESEHEQTERRQVTLLEIDLGRVEFARCNVQSTRETTRRLVDKKNR